MKPTGTYAFGPRAFPGAAAPTLPPAPPAFSPPPYVAPPQPSFQSAAAIKIVDWMAVGYAALECVVSLVFGVLAIGQVPFFAAILLPGALVAIVVLVQKLIGVTIDPGRGTLRFCSFFVPREVALADLRDANCQFAITMSPSRLAWAICASGGGSKGRHGSGSAMQRTYMVNLSGAFGSRQVRFYSKRWRDNFLSILRDQAPGCRITRWY